jgi:hypothetical protein
MRTGWMRLVKQRCFGLGIGYVYIDLVGCVVFRVILGQKDKINVKSIYFQKFMA